MQETLKEVRIRTGPTPTTSVASLILPSSHVDTPSLPLLVQIRAAEVRHQDLDQLFAMNSLVRWHSK